MTDWQKFRYGDTPEARAAITYWRDRGWPVDDQGNREVIDRINDFKAGYKEALGGKVPSTLLDRWNYSGLPSVASFNHVVDVANALHRKLDQAAPRKLTVDEAEHLYLMGMTQDGSIALGEGAAQRILEHAKRLVPGEENERISMLVELLLDHLDHARVAITDAQQWADKWKDHAFTAKEERDRLRSRLDVTTDYGHAVPVSFSSVMDSIDSHHTQDAIENLVVWHHRRRELAEAERDKARREADDLRATLEIVKLSLPTEDQLASQIEEMCKYLAMENGFTLAGIARLLIDCQRRMAADRIMLAAMAAEKASHNPDVAPQGTIPQPPGAG